MMMIAASTQLCYSKAPALSPSLFSRDITQMPFTRPRSHAQPLLAAPLDDIYCSFISMLTFLATGTDDDDRSTMEVGASTSVDYHHDLIRAFHKVAWLSRTAQ